MQSILFLTTANLATNPRLVKEIDLAVTNKFDVQVIYFEFDNWSSEINKQIISHYPQVRFININTEKIRGIEWLLSIFYEKTGRFLSHFFRLSIRFKSYAFSRRSYTLVKHIREAKKIDLVVGHNPGALYATYLVSKRFHCKVGFDIEDYHPGEGSSVNLQNLILDLMKYLLPKMNYVSFASPLIKKEVEKNISFKSSTKLSLILNYFSKEDFKLSSSIASTKIKLVWFSQNIDFGRGLENAIPILFKYKDKIELHLYGNLKIDFLKKHEKYKDLLIFHPPLNQDALHHRMSFYDFGLSLESNFADFNREICLTNKIITYFQSGLFILATNTLAQNLFIKDNPESGIIFDKQFSNFEEVLNDVIQNFTIIKNKKNDRFSYSQKFNWENESEQILYNWINI